MRICLIDSVINADPKHIDNGIVEEAASSASHITGKSRAPWNLLTSELFMFIGPKSGQATQYNTTPLFSLIF